MKRTLTYFSFATISLILLISLTGFFGSQSSQQLKSAELWMELDQSDAQKLQIALPSWAPLVKRVEGAVLVVSTKAVIKRQNTPFGFPDLPDFFFGPRGRPEPREELRNGQGSGFIINPDGYALTNNHVIENAKTIKVKVGGELKEYEAEVIGSDEATDVALIKIKSDRKDWPVIPLGSSSSVQVGDYTLAIGNPLGLELSVSSGIVSARGRRDVQPSGRNGLFDFLQVDNAINPGNSGGPLVNARGEAIGINTAMAQGQGIGFAIPIDQVKQILPQLKTYGKASRSYIGVVIDGVTDELAKALDLNVRHGAVVREVKPESPAGKAGIKPGDVILEFDGEIIKDPSTLSLKAGLAGVGKKIQLKVLRNKKTISLALTLEEMPGSPEEKSHTVPAEKDKVIELFDGLSVTTLDESARKKLNIDKDLQGARIVEASPMIEGRLGLTANDVIFKANGMTVNSASDLKKLVDKTAKGELLQFHVRRGKTELFMYFPKP